QAAEDARGEQGRAGAPGQGLRRQEAAGLQEPRHRLKQARLPPFPPVIAALDPALRCSRTSQSEKVNSLKNQDYFLIHRVVLQNRVFRPAAWLPALNIPALAWWHAGDCRGPPDQCTLCGPVDPLRQGQGPGGAAAGPGLLAHPPPALRL